MSKTISNTKEINGLTTNVAVILSEMKTMKDDVKEIKERLEREYVTKTEFMPTKNNVNLIVTTMLVAVIGGIMAVVLK